MKLESSMEIGAGVPLQVGMSSESPVEILKAQVKEVHELWQQEVVKRQLLEAEVAELRASANGMQRYHLGRSLQIIFLLMVQ
jgi:hypothetical protein